MMEKKLKSMIELNIHNADIDVYLAAPIQRDSIVDGEGLRTVIWFQGCPHHCLGCHNPESHAFKKGILKKTGDIFREIENLELQDGITLSGGDPFAQPEAAREIAKYAKSKNLNVWAYTGYKFEEIIELGNKNSIYLDLLMMIDVLVDDKFILTEKSLNLKFRGSKNQRILDVKKSLKKGEAFLIPKYKKEKKNLLQKS